MDKVASVGRTTARTYARRRPELSAVYRTVQRHLADFVGSAEARRGLCPSCGGRRMAETAAHLVDHVLPVVPIRQWVLSMPYSLRTMLGYEPELLGVVLGVFVRALSGWIRGKVREQVGPLDARDVQFGAVTFIQRFGDALDLNPHFHTLVLDGAYVVRHGLFQGFVHVEAPSDEDVAGIAALVATRVVRMLRRRGKVEDDEVAAVEDDGSVLLPCMAASVRRVGALGEGEGRALRRPGRRQHVEMVKVDKRRCANVEGFSLHADVCVPARDRAQLERLCRYVARPAIASERLELLDDGRVRYRFKRTWRDGSVAVEFDPIDFVGKLAALVPRPHANLVRYHGCLGDAPEVWPARGPPTPPESLGSAPWLDDDPLPRAHDDTNPRAHDDTNWMDLE